MPVSRFSSRMMRGDLLDDRGLDALGGLVEQHQVRVADQRAADGELLLLAAGQGAGRAGAARSARIGKQP